MLRIYTDAGYRREDRVAGLALVCTSFVPWLAEALFVHHVDTCVEAELAAVTWAIRWADGLPVEILTDCKPVAEMCARPFPPPGVPPAATVIWIRRASHLANVHADRLATRALRDVAGVPPHRIEAPPGWLAEPAEMDVAWPGGRRQRARVVAVEDQIATVLLGYHGRRGRRFRSTPTRVPFAWLKPSR